MNQNDYRNYILPRLDVGDFPDMKASGGFDSATMTEESEVTGSIIIENVGNVDSSGLITVYITKPGDGTTTYTLPAGWTTVIDEPGGSQFTTTNVILIGNSVTIPFAYNNTGGIGDKLIDIRIANGSGGEINYTNNSKNATITVT